MSQMAPTRILILGASGLFGSLLARGLAAEPGFHLILAARELGRLQGLQSSLNLHADTHAEVWRLDARDPQWAKLLIEQGIDLLIHCAGPFQGQDYQVARACLRAGVHYVDLADARLFVAGIAGLDAEAKAAGRFVLSGASTVPAFSGAIVTQFASELAVCESIEIAIAPGNRTERGLATIAAILSYCGKPFPCWREGRQQTTRGWFGLHRRRFAGPIGKRWQSDVDLPDLAFLPGRYKGLKQLSLTAGLELSFLHLGLWLLGGLARFRLLPLAHMAPLLKWCSDWLIPFGSDCGGMQVLVRGRNSQGSAASRQFDLIAERGLGPNVPTLAARIIAKRLRDGKPPLAGARAADQELPLAAFVAEAKAIGLGIQLQSQGD